MSERNVRQDAITNSEVAKYRKKKNSSKSRSNNKADHKHELTKCLFQSESRLYLGSYCKHCGKINNWVTPTEKFGDGRYASLSTEEILNRFTELEIIEVDDLWNEKFIPILV